VTRTPLAVALLAFTLTLPGLASGQVNIEALRRDAPPLGRSGTVGGDLSFKTGNVSFVSFDLNARLDHVTPTESRLLLANGGLGFLDRDRFASAGLLHYRVVYTTVDPRFSPEWFGQVNYDRSQLLDFRAVLGGGARTSFARGQWGQFGAGSDLMLEHEWLSLPDTAVHRAQTLEVRWSSFATLRVVASQTTVITSTTYVQPTITDFGDLRALENFRLATSITEELALTVSFDMRYDSRPPDGIASLDTSLRAGVTYSY